MLMNIDDDEEEEDTENNCFTNGLLIVKQKKNGLNASNARDGRMLLALEEIYTNQLL